MRGGDERSGSLFSSVDLEARVRPDHPLRAVRGIVNEALGALSGEFSAMYSPMGRPSIPPEKLLRAMLLQAFYSIRSERQLMERLEFDLLFRWFVGIGVDDAVWDHSTFSKNRDRLLEGEVAAKLLSAVLSQPRVKRLLSTDHFSVDGTLIEAWSSMKSFKPKDGAGPPDEGGGRNREADFHGQKCEPARGSDADRQSKSLVSLIRVGSFRGSDSQAILPISTRVNSPGNDTLGHSRSGRSMTITRSKRDRTARAPSPDFRQSSTSPRRPGARLAREETPSAQGRG